MRAAAAEPATDATIGPAGGTLGQRLRAALVAAASWLACRLPERPLIALADLAGDIAYRRQPERAAQARRNLGRVVSWLDQEGLGGDMARQAATDPRALERLVRAAFRHHARYYLEVARTPGMTPAYVRERLLIETPEVVEGALADRRPIIIIGLHFGAIELPALYLALRADSATAPMETIGDPPLQRWFVRTRGSVGIRIVGLREARRELVAALRRGEPVGLVADRDLTGGGVPVRLFGAPAPLPLGPALLALESGAPVFVTAVRREGNGRYRGRLEALPTPPAEGTRRERATAIVEASARAFERAIAVAPEQWWAVFFRIWPDLESNAAGPEATASAR